jgi:glycerol kinase
MHLLTGLLGADVKNRAMKYILALDQGTTSSRAILFNHEGGIVATAQKEFRQIFPKPGWVEHDAQEIWATQAGVAAEVLQTARAKAADVAAIGITNQRETTVIWDRKTGKPVCNAIVWQDRRTASICDKLRAQKLDKLIQRKTGLVVDAYFSATKVQWMLQNVKGLKARAAKGELAFGTIDTWLLWNLTGGKVHATDVSNASRTMLYDIRKGDWDDELLNIFGVPRSMLPEVKDSSGVFGETSLLGGSIPVAGIAGDQQSALFGQVCTKPGMVKNTYGTGCFMLMNTGTKPIASKNKLLTTIAWRIGGRTEYALEGSVFIAGAAIQWLRDGLGIIKNSADVEALAASVPDTGGVYLVPAFAGLGRSALGCVCAWHARGHDTRHHGGAHRACGAGRHRLAGHGHLEGHGGRRGHQAEGTPRRWRCLREQPAHADAVRSARRARRASESE